MKIKKIITAAVLCVSAMSLSSCLLALGAVAGAGGFAYVEGKYTGNIDATVPQAYNAALKAVQTNDDYVLVSKKTSPTSSTINAATKSDQTDFYVQIDRLTDNASKVTIKFGTFGNQAQSVGLLNEIKKNI